MKQNYYRKEREREERIAFRINAVILLGIVALTGFFMFSTLPGCATTATVAETVATEAAEVVRLAYDVAGRQLVSEYIEGLVEDGKISDTQAICLYAVAEAIYQRTASVTTVTNATEDCDSDACNPVE